MAKRVLVTGATGFIGSHLMELLGGDQDFDAIGTSRNPAPGSSLLQSHLRTLSDAELLFEQVHPDVVIHCSGLGAGSDPDALFNVNVSPSVALMSAALRRMSDVRIVLLGSAAEYGSAAARIPLLTENDPCEPLGAYGLSKVWQTEAMRYYARQGVNAVVARIFNLVGPRMPTTLSIGSFARQLGAIGRREAPALMKVGNLSSRRDFLGIGDGCRALALLALQGRAGQVYNVSSGTSIQIRDALQALIQGAGVTPEIEVDPERLRAHEIHDIRGSSALLQEHTGWKQQESALGAIESLGSSVR